MSRLPSYRIMQESIKNHIQSGKYPVGQLLPSESEFEKIYKVSRTTVRRAMEELAHEGLLEIKQGRGTLVKDYKTRQDLTKVTSVTESLKRKGYDIRTKSMYIDFISADDKLAQELGLLTGDLIARVQRIQLADDKPIVIMKNYIPSILVPGMEAFNNRFTALYQFLEEHYQINIDSAKDKIYAKSADFTESEMLDVQPGTALLCIRRICFMEEKPVCVDQVSILGDRYELDLTMRGRFK